MGYESLFEAGVALASSQFETMKLNITHRAWIGENGDGEDSFADPVTLRGIVDLTKRVQVTPGGRTVMTFAHITFLDPIADTAPNAGRVREQPIDPRDLLVLPDGGTAPVVAAGGPADSNTSKGFITEVTLGTVIRGA
jgi:hypothetical protein